MANPFTDYLGIDTILTFAQKDTTFIYKSKRDDAIVLFVDLSLFDSKYTISKDGNNYKTVKQSLADSTYKEIIFYDKNYRIYKFINTWQGYECVYTVHGHKEFKKRIIDSTNYDPCMTK